VPVEFLTDSLRAEYGRFTGEPSPIELARCFHLDDADRQRLTQYRQDHNRLGYALQLGTARFLGTFLTDPVEAPEAVVQYVGGQLAIPDGMACLRLYSNADTQRRHVREIREAYSYHQFNDQPYHFALTRWLFTRAWFSGERPMALFDGATRWLIERKILLPCATTLERLVAQVRSRANGRLWRILAAAPSAEQETRLKRLLETNAAGLSQLDRIRRAPRRVSSRELTWALKRLADIRALGAGALDLSRIPPRRIRMLARYAAAARAQAIARMTDERQIAALVAFAWEYEILAQDDVLDVFDQVVAKLMNEARDEGQRERLQTLHDLDRAALTLARACEMLLGEADAAGDIREAIFAEVSRDQLAAALAVVGALGRPLDDVYYDQLAERYRTLRWFLPTFLATLRFQGVAGASDVLDALDFLASIEGKHAPDIDRAPLAVVSGRWRSLVIQADGQIDRKAYTFCVLERLRTDLRRRDVFVAPSYRWADPRAKLFGEEQWEGLRSGICRDMNLPLAAETALDELATHLDAAYRLAADNLSGNTALRIEQVAGRDRLVLSPLEKLDEPASLVDLRQRVAALMPNVDLPEILLEVNRWTNFASAFTHLGEDSAWIEDLPVSICAVLMAEACNIGSVPLVRHDNPALKPDRLRWVEQHYLRAETITAANGCLVDHQASIGLSEAWGGGEVASVDGLRFVVPVKTIAAGPNPKYFGRQRGVTLLGYVSDQYTLFHSIVVTGTVRDSLYVLDGLLEHQTSLQPTELMTDTASYSDIVFGLFWLLGYQFSPRLADLGDLRFWRLDPAADYGTLSTIGRHRIRSQLITANWDDMLRVAGSLKHGEVRASELMHALQRGGHSSTLATAIGELGRIIKTLYLLAYIDDEGYRRRILRQLNRGEQRHAVARAVFFGKKGELRKKYREGQEDQLGALGLVVNMIALWNTTYIDRALTRLRQDGHAVREEDVARLSPLASEHINMLGRYRFALPEELEADEFRPLKELTPAG
jgi:TnpA family transposase